MVAQDSRVAEVFERYKIDFCCNGNKVLTEACPDDGVRDVVERELLAVLETTASSGGSSVDYRTWPLDLLADFLEKKYHRETSRQIAVIQQYLDKICLKHGEAHPELFEIKDLFEAGAGELTAHMQREELVLFPFVRKMVQTGKRPIAAFGTVENPIRALSHEHEQEGERFRKIAELSVGYSAPPDGCQSYKLTFAMLKEFESMLHIHIHLENNLLFPRALAMEQQYKQ